MKPQAFLVLSCCLRAVAEPTDFEQITSILDSILGSHPILEFQETITAAEALQLVRDARPFVVRQNPEVLKSKAVRSWSDPNYLSEVAGEETVLVETRSSMEGPVFAGSDAGRMDQMPLREFLKRQGDPARTDFIYAAQINVPEELEPLANDFSPPSFTERLQRLPMDWCTGWFGGGGEVTALHTDDDTNVYVVVKGVKEYAIAPLQDMAHLNALTLASSASKNIFSQHDAFHWLDNPDDSPARFQRVMLVPGDVLVLPAWWPHAVRAGPEPAYALSMWFENEHTPAVRKLFTSFYGGLPRYNSPSEIPAADHETSTKKRTVSEEL
mmetsp:Transcript_2931/g.6166  ORF Transcript_2931/g.6166 Transcript_2931/m.6166 type:complete len:326 (-) Transcript_2931:84-1061(-)